ncbi:NAD(+) diphosphatase [Microbacterium sp. ZXX196]|uniref:NAD(+) diphosphatase n=1 Tax=Microbacterium sp. ZXX196 TaxID=2609291 RepID=UPI0012B73E88|nr:NAD(+) diphosphatase [Microbacterium sp. ZXX196]MTE22895.1 NAD(+) diphosphatase [Microbacterium sp. ZXX196]
MTVQMPDVRVDASAAERTDEGVLARLRAGGDARVVVVSGDALALATDRDALELVSVDSAPAGATWAFLGRAEGGNAVLLAAAPAGADAPSGTRWGAFRDVGARLAPGATDLAVSAVALARWHVAAPFCPACGALTRFETAGWSRRCSGCGREHFPRTDPAVIVAVSRADDEALLLGANAAWGGRMYSCFAGFVEAGETAEQAVHRELAEEAGIRVRDVRYVASQAWPYPRSLMLGFHATVVDAGEAREDGEEIVALRWFSRDEVARGLRGEGDVSLPGGVSVAHRLIRAWHDRSASAS